MNPSATISFTKKIPLRLRRLTSGHHTIRGSLDDAEEIECLVGGEFLYPETIHHQSLPTQLEIADSPIPKVDAVALLQHFVQVARDLRPSLPSSCRWVDPDDLGFISKCPIAAGSFANILEATHHRRKVMLKSYRCYVSSDVAQIAARFWNEIQVWAFLQDRGVDVVPLAGAYSTEAHPFGLIYEFMDGLDLRQHLRNTPDAGRLNLLLGVSQCLSRMHGQGVVHGDLRMMNILIDRNGTPRIAGLGNGYILPHSAGKAESTTAERVSRNCPPESTWPGVSPRITGATHPTKAGDVYAFSVMAFEVLTGRPPFSEMSELAAACSMLRGSRPPRPNHHEMSDRAWQMIQSCWNPAVSKRMQIEEVVDLLEEELGRVSA